MILSNEYKIKKIRILYIDRKNVWGSEGVKLFCSHNYGEEFQQVAEYKSLFWETMNFSQILSRMTRAGFGDLAITPESLIGTVPYKVVRAQKGSKNFKPVFDIKKGRRPLNIAVIPSGNLYFGDYFGNNKREEVCIYCSENDGKTWNIIYTFPKNTIRHIHKIIYDFYRKGLLILTGDEDNECKILFTPDNFKTIETIISGNQDARAVSIIPTKDGFIIPTDTPLKQNYIQFLDNNGKLTKLCEIPGSSFYSVAVGNNYFVSTGVEPSKVNRSPYATLWGSKNGFDWKKLFEAKKDFWHPKLFQYGNIILPHYDGDSKFLFATMIGLENRDNISYRWEIT